MNVNTKRMPSLLLKKTTDKLTNKDIKFLNIFKNKRGYQYCYKEFTDEHFLYKTIFNANDKDEHVLKVWFNDER